MELAAQVLEYLKERQDLGAIHYGKIAVMLGARPQDVLAALESLGMQVVESQTHKGAWRWASWSE